MLPQAVALSCRNGSRRYLPTTKCMNFITSRRVTSQYPSRNSHTISKRVYNSRRRRFSSSNPNSKKPSTQTATASANASTKNTTTCNNKEDTRYIIPKSFAIGSLAGVCGSLAGMGGGFVMIPLMTSNLLKLSQHQAHGTSLFAVAATGVAGALGYQGHVHYDAAAALAASGMVTASLGASVTTMLSATKLKKALGIFMICVAPLVPLKGYMTEKHSEQLSIEDSDDEKSKLQTKKSADQIEQQSWQDRLLPPAMIGLGSGFLAGLFGVGGGAVVVPALTVCTDMNHYEALGTSLCAMAFPAITGTITHYRKGNVALRVAPVLAVGAFCGGYFGGKLGLQINENTLRWGFSGLMVTLGVRTLLKA